MADLAKYIVALEAETAKYRREISRAVKALNDFERNQRRTLNKVDQGFKGLSRSAERFGRTFIGAFGAAAILRSAKAFAELSDSVELFEARLRAALGGEAVSSGLRESLITVATNSGQSLETVISLFQQVSSLSGQLGATNEQIVKFADNLFKLGTIGGSSADEIRRSLVQMLQILAKGKAEAQDLKIIMEATPEVARELERQVGLIPGGLLQANEAGINLARKIFPALSKEVDGLQQKFDDFPKTFERSTNSILTNLRLSTKALSDLFGLTSAGGALVSVFDSLANKARKLYEYVRDSNGGIIGVYEALVNPPPELQEGFAGKGVIQRTLPVETIPTAPFKQYEEELDRLREKFVDLLQPVDTSGFKEFERRLDVMKDRLDVLRQAEDARLDEERAIIRQTAQEDIAWARRVSDEKKRLADEERAIMDMIANDEVQSLIKINEERAQFSQMFADNLIQGAETGFDGVLKGWARTLLQMVARAAATDLFGALFPKGLFTDGGAFEAIGSFFGRANGGAVAAGAPYLVGERGPELFVPATAGNIVPNNQKGGGMVFNIDARGATPGVEQRIRSAVNEAVNLARADRVESRRRGRP